MKNYWCLIVFGLFASDAAGAEWAAWPRQQGSPMVAAGFKHDDGGTLLIVCDTQKRLMSILLSEPRATWKEGDTIKVTTRADDGSQMAPSTGIVIGPTSIVVKDESTWDLYTMGKANGFFATGVGGYARVWPTTNFKKMTGPVLKACGDNWPD
jgi:hypothetical protein